MANPAHDTRAPALAVVLLVSMQAGTASAAAAPLESYARLPQVRHVALSPDGRTLAFVGNTRGGDALFVYPLDGAAEPVANLVEVKTRQLRFAGNEHVIVQASTKSRVFGFDHGWEHSEAFAYGLRSRKIRQLLRSTADIYPGQTGLGRIVGVSADRDAVLMPAYMGNHVESLHYSLLRVDLGNGRGRLVKRGTANTIDWLVNEDGEAVAREEYSDAANRYGLDIMNGGGSWQRSLEREEKFPSANLLGRHIERGSLVLGSYSAAQIYSLFELVGDELAPLPIPGGQAGDIEAVLTDDQRGLLGVRFAGMRPRYGFFAPQLASVYQRLRTQTEGMSLWVEGWSDDYSRLLLRVFDGRSAGHYIVYDTETSGFVKVLSIRDDLPAEAIGEVMSIEYRARDGLTIPAVLTWPPGDVDREGLAAVVLPHGGPAAYDKIEFDWLAQFLASRGYLVLQPNFRGSTGFGEQHTLAGRGQWGRAMNDDLHDGVAALVRMGAVDEERVCIVGASYGGYAALAAGAFEADRYRCVAAIAPVADLEMMIRHAEEVFGRQARTVDYWKEQVGDERGALRAISPVHHAESFTAPVLLVHGKDDTVVPIRQSAAMEKALQQAGKDVELVRIKGGDHWMSRAATRRATLRAVEEFLAANLLAVDDGP